MKKKRFAKRKYSSKYNYGKYHVVEFRYHIADSNRLSEYRYERFNSKHLAEKYIIECLLNNENIFEWFLYTLDKRIDYIYDNYKG